MKFRHLAVIALAIMAAFVAVGLPTTSGATFTASSRSTATINAASDWTPPTVSVQNPGSPIKDTVTVNAIATDAESGIASTTLEYQLDGGATWTTICVDGVAPYSCAWNTKAVADGAYLLRARATDNAGYSTISSAVSTVVANSVLVVLDNPGEFLRGTAPLTARTYNGGLLSLTVRIERSVAGADNWSTICSGLTSTVTCNWATTSVANQEYDLRAVAIVGTTTYTSAVIPDVLVDNAAPTVTMTDPGTPLRGSVTLTSSSSDAHSGVASVVIQYAVSGSGTWKSACTVSDVTVGTCRFDTTTTADGTYSFRAVATDFAGNTTTSTAVNSRVVDNTVSSVSVEDPGAFLTGVVTVNASGNSSAGVASIRIQRSPAGANTWTDLCVDTSSPYSCPWDTAAVADGLYDLRAILTDSLGRTTTSATLTNRRVDNSPLRGLDVQTVNGGSSAGKLDAGDQLALTYSGQVNPASISSGWNGSATAVTLRLRDGNILGLGNRGDTVDVLRSNVAVNLGSVNLKQEYIKTNKTTTFNATMVATNTTVNGAPVTVVTVTLGTVASGNGLRGGNPGHLVWTPSSSATDPSGKACSPAPVTETGVLDRDF